MDFASQQRRPGKHPIGFGVVVVLHIALGYALVNGLGRKIVDVIKAPLETKLIEEVKPPPPPPPDKPVAPPAPKPQAVPARIDVSTCEKPEYPSAALRADATGTSKIRFTVDATGAVAKAEIERSAGASREHRLLDRTAIEALSKCRFKPGIDEQGKPIGGTTMVDYVWKTD